MKIYTKMRSEQIGEELLFRNKKLGKSTFLKVFVNVYSNTAKNKTGAAIKLSLFKGKNNFKPYSSIFVDPDEIDDFIHFLDDMKLIFGEYLEKAEKPSLNQSTFNGKRFLSGHVMLSPISSSKFHCEAYLTFSGGREHLDPKHDLALITELSELLKLEENYVKMTAYSAVGA